jgi:hypothetical protein
MESGTDLIKWCDVARVDGSTVRYADGGWNRADDCFFTEAQCRKHHRLPPKDWKDTRASVADVLERMAAKLREDL